MYKDIINYALAEGITEEHLLEVAKKVTESWMTKQEGFLGWEIHENNDGNYTDIVYWNSEEDANNSTKDMVNIPNASDWYACYKADSTSNKKLHKVGSFK